VRPGRVDLVGSRGFRPGGGADPVPARHAELGQQLLQCSSATALARLGNNKQQTAPVEQHRRPGRRAAPGPADSVIVGLAGPGCVKPSHPRVPGVRRRALRGPRGDCPCRCTCGIMESAPSRPVDLGVGAEPPSRSRPPRAPAANSCVPQAFSSVSARAPTRASSAPNRDQQIHSWPTWYEPRTGEKVVTDTRGH
jgi:hypothetical protein